MKYTDRILAFFKVAVLSMGLDAFTQKTWDKYEKNNTDIEMKNLGV